MYAIYVRQSVDKKDSISLETQVEFCKKEFTEKAEYRVYSDKGYSGSNMSRPAFQELLKDIEKRSIDKIIVYRLDRISRSVLDFANLIDFINRYGVSFVSTQEKFDTNTPIGRAMLSIIMVFAQLERETLQIRIKDNYYSRAGKGMYPGGPAPYGFTLTKSLIDGQKIKHLIYDMQKAEIIENMYNWYTTEKLTLGAISGRLNEQGIKGNKGAAWSSNRVSMVLRNPIYVKADINVYKYYKERGCEVTNSAEDFTGENGCYLYGKRESSTRKYSTYEEHKLSLAPSWGIVDADTFLKCQRMLDRNTQIDNKAWGSKTWLTGIVKCAECGRAVIVKDSTWKKDGKTIKRSYLKCTGAIEVNGCSCKKHLGSVEDIEGIVFKEIEKVIENYKDIKVEVTKRISKDQNLLEAKITECDERISTLIDLVFSGDETSSKYINIKIAEIDKKKREYEARLNKINDGYVERTADSIEVMLEHWNDMNNRQRKELASFFIKRIDLAKDKMNIYWKENFGLSEHYK